MPSPCNGYLDGYSVEELLAGLDNLVFEHLVYKRMTHWII